MIFNVPFKLSHSVLLGNVNENIKEVTLSVSMSVLAIRNYSEPVLGMLA